MYHRSTMSRPSAVITRLWCKRNHDKLTKYDGSCFRKAQYFYQYPTLSDPIRSTIHIGPAPRYDQTWSPVLSERSLFYWTKNFPLPNHITTSIIVNSLNQSDATRSKHRRWPEKEVWHISQVLYSSSRCSCWVQRTLHGWKYCCPCSRQAPPSPLRRCSSEGHLFSMRQQKLKVYDGTKPVVVSKKCSTNLMKGTGCCFSKWKDWTGKPNPHTIWNSDSQREAEERHHSHFLLGPQFYFRTVILQTNLPEE